MFVACTQRGGRAPSTTPHTPLSTRRRSMNTAAGLFAHPRRVSVALAVYTAALAVLALGLGATADTLRTQAT